MDFGARKPAAGAAPGGDVVKDTTTAGFAKDVLEASRAGLKGSTERPSSRGLADL